MIFVVENENILNLNFETKKKEKIESNASLLIDLKANYFNQYHINDVSIGFWSLK